MMQFNLQVFRDQIVPILLSWAQLTTFGILNVYTHQHQKF
jgi:hypothetical protein